MSLRRLIIVSFFFLSFFANLFAGGNVVNLAIELNGQPPLQVYVKPCKEYRIVLRSIDMGAMEVVNTFGELQDYCKIG